MILPLLVVQLSVSARVPDRLVKNLLLALMTPPVAILVYSTFVRLAETRPVVEVGPRGARKEHGLVAFVGALFLLIVVAILAIAGAFSIAETSTAAAMLIPFFFAFPSAQFEELIFWGVPFRIIEQGLGSWLALVISAVIFGGLHLINENATGFGAIAVMPQAGIILGGPSCKHVGCGCRSAFTSPTNLCNPGSSASPSPASRPPTVSSSPVSPAPTC